MSHLEAIWEKFRIRSSLMEPYRISQIPDHLSKFGAKLAFEGQVTVEDKTIILQVGLDRAFPRSLPLIFLFPWNALGFIPHVDENGKVCYAQREGLLLDRHAPTVIIEEAIQRSLKTLGKGVRRENQYDFVEEFESYWSRLDGTERVRATIAPSNMVQKITAIVVPDQGKGNGIPLCLTSDPGITKSYLGLDSSGHYTHRSALYVPFKEGTLIKPPSYSTFWSQLELQNIVHSGLSHQNYKTLCRLARKHVDEHSVVFCLPRPSGGRALFGIHFVEVERSSPLIPGGTARRCIPFLLDRRDREYLLPRGGANLKLRQNHVAVLGCGSVGGFLALELARAGIQHLTLVDPDYLYPENTFRHVLGRSSWHLPKVLALKKEIEDKIPYVQIRAFRERGEDLVRRGGLRPRDYDLVVSAIGDDTINLHLNQIICDEVGAPPIIFTWLEPYGIGGHALLTGKSRGAGCFECLFTPTPNAHDYYLHNRAAFAAENQFFGKTVSGCSDLLTPYGSSDAVKTAALAASLVIDTLLGKEPGNPLISWKGCADEFLEAGFRLSGRYSMTEQQIFDRRYDYQVANCPICGS